MKLELKKHKYYLLVLTAMFFVLIYLFVPEGSVFGSNTDWMSQHAELAETRRCWKPLIPFWLLSAS